MAAPSCRPSTSQFLSASLGCWFQLGGVKGFGRLSLCVSLPPQKWKVLIYLFCGCYQHHSFLPPYFSLLQCEVSCLIYFLVLCGTRHSMGSLHGQELQPTVPSPITVRGRGHFYCSVNGAFSWQPYSCSIISHLFDQQGKISPAGTSGGTPHTLYLHRQPHLTSTDFLTHFNHKEHSHQATLEFRKQPSLF